MLTAALKLMSPLGERKMELWLRLQKFRNYINKHETSHKERLRTLETGVRMVDRTPRVAGAAVTMLMSPRGGRETGLIQEPLPVGWWGKGSCDIEVPAQGHQAVASLLAVVDPDALAESWEEHEVEKPVFYSAWRAGWPVLVLAGQASLSLFLF